MGSQYNRVAKKKKIKLLGWNVTMQKQYSDKFDKIWTFVFFLYIYMHSTEMQFS